MGSETIRVYIPSEFKTKSLYTDGEIEKFKQKCCELMESMTETDCIKYARNNEGKLVQYEATCLTLYGRVSWYNQSIRELAVDLARALNIDFIHIEVNDVSESILANDISNSTTAHNQNNTTY